MVCDLSEPGSVPDLLHAKEINVKVEKNDYNPCLDRDCHKKPIDCAIVKAQVSILLRHALSFGAKPALGGGQLLGPQR